MSNLPRPLRTLFALTSMPVGGAETLLANLIDRLDRSRIEPEICCLKAPGPLGEQLAAQVPVHAHLIRHKYDFTVLPRLARLMKTRRIDALVTVGAGDKMFWGRLAAYFARTPVVASALHSTGWPDGLGRLNRWLTPLTDVFIAVAETHGDFLVQREGLPLDKVVVIPNGIDTDRFRPDATQRIRLRKALEIPVTQPVCTIVAALRPEKNHTRLLRVAAEVVAKQPDARFLLVGDGPERPALEALQARLALTENVCFLGCRHDIPQLLAASDLFLLTSDNEANPVSIMEAMSCGLPVVSTDVGSIHEMVEDSRNGFLVRVDDERQFASRVLQLISDDSVRRQMGTANRLKAVERGSLDIMVDGYQELLETTFARKSVVGVMAADHADREVVGSSVPRAMEPA